MKKLRWGDLITLIGVMGKPLEKDFREKVRKALGLLRRCKIYPVQQSSISGHPDFMICLNSYNISLELKRDASRPLSPLQEYHHDHHNKCGGYAFRADPTNWSDIFTFFMYLSKKQPRKRWSIDDAKNNV